MKKIAFVCLLSFIIISCKNHYNEYPDNPAWLNARIAHMETVDYYYGTKVFLYEWHSAFYYWISIPISSCMMCEFYNYAGDEVLTPDNIDDFQKNGKMIKIVWQRDKF
jgi:hypothetical protein